MKPRATSKLARSLMQRIMQNEGIPSGDWQMHEWNSPPLFRILGKKNGWMGCEISPCCTTREMVDWLEYRLYHPPKKSNRAEMAKDLDELCRRYGDVNVSLAENNKDREAFLDKWAISEDQ